MKFKSVASILKSSKTIIISEGNDCQWLGDGSALYPCYGFPQLTQKTIFTILDISEAKADKFYVKEQELPATMNFADSVSDEVMLKRGPFELCIDEVKVEPLISGQGIIFINSKYLKPFSDEKEGIQLYERTTENGTPYIAVKSGFILIGVISPINIVTKELVVNLENILKLSRVALMNAPKGGVE